VRERLKGEVEELRGEIVTLMQTAVEASSEAMTAGPGRVVISGERNLLAVSDFSSDMTHLRRAFELFEQKTQLMRLLDVSSQAEGVRIFIGGESQVVPFRGTVGGERALRGGRPGGRHAGRDRPHPHGLRPHDPDRGHHVQAGEQRAQPPQASRSRASSAASTSATSSVRS
jgi:hypothetical protein